VLAERKWNVSRSVDLSLLRSVVCRLAILVSNHRLSKTLAQLSNELEDRVTARTSELNALNRVATSLSRCETSEEVLNTGLRLACEATRLSAGAVWILKPDGHTELIARYQIPHFLDEVISTLPERVSLLMERTKIGKAVVLTRSDLATPSFPKDLVPALPSFLVAAPLVSRGNVLGILGEIGDVDRRQAWGCCGLLEAVGAEMCVALESAQRFEHATYLADRDPVTNLYNHRAFQRCLQEELKRQQRAGRPSSLLMMDIDGFKLFNDTYGHPMGDQVLRDIAGVLTEASRETDVVARYGGDEFAAILPDTSADGAIAYAHRVRAAMGEHTFTRSDGGRVPLRLSFGIAAYPQDGHTTHELVGCADTNMYASKDLGGDTVTAANDTSSREIAKVGIFGILDGLITAVDHKDRYTRKHSEQVTRLSMIVGEAMGLSEETQRTLRIAGLLHDVGKIGVPDRLLRKPGQLDDEEFAAIRQHARLGEMIVKDVPNITDVLSAIGAHHERYDGRGYPRGLKGSEHTPVRSHPGRSRRVLRDDHGPALPESLDTRRGESRAIECGGHPTGSGGGQSLRHCGP
jgi:diguanylate cyclase (GGDEF)-like protein